MILARKMAEKTQPAQRLDDICRRAPCPLILTERGIVALVASAHRAGSRLNQTVFFSLVSPMEQKKILLLAGMLRIADSLDYCIGGPHRKSTV